MSDSSESTSAESSERGQPLPTVPKELEHVVRAGVLAQREVPEGVALGGSVCALYAGHRTSLDIDFVLFDLSQRFSDVQRRLQANEHWQEQRVVPPVLILGALDGVPVGFRQLRRPTPLETRELHTPDGTLIIPTLEELLRTKAYLAYQRNAMRDCLDFAELATLLNREQVTGALLRLDEKLASPSQPTVAFEIMRSLAACAPHDFTPEAYNAFRLLKPRLRTWNQVVAGCRQAAADLADKLLPP